LACSSLLGCFGLSFLCFSSIYFSFAFDGNDLFGIILYFSFLNTSSWIFLWVDKGKYYYFTFFFNILLSSSVSYNTSWCYQSPSQVKHAKLELKSEHEHFLHLNGYTQLCYSFVCLHLSINKYTCKAASMYSH
jgi:hypothetical protein